MTWLKRKTNERVRQQLNSLVKQQIQALRIAMTVGMTSKEAGAYDERQRRLERLMNILKEDGGYE